MEVTKFPEAAIEELLKRSTNLPDDIRGEGSVDLPPNDSLADLLRVSLYASSAAEEGRPTSFVLCYLHRGSEYYSQWRDEREGWYPIWFDESRELSTKEIVKLAPALNPITGMILVELDPERGLLIVGIARTGGGWHRHSEGGADFELEQLSFSLRIEAHGPGHLSIRNATVHFVEFRNGEIVRAAHRILISPGPLLTHVDGFGVTLLSSEGKGPEYAHYSLWLAEVVRGIQAQGHGGTLLLLGDPLEAEPLKIRLRPSTPVADLNGRVTALIHGGAPRSPRQRLEIKSVRSAARFVGGLTAVDGAVVLDSSLNLLGFGAEIRVAEDCPAEVALDTAATKTEAWNIEDRGMRHRSAARFCFSAPSAIAFVVSQDGDVTAMTRCDDRVLV